MKFALLLLLLGGFLCGLHGAEGQDTDLLIMMTKLMTRVLSLEIKDQTHQSEVQALKTQVQSLNNQIQNLETKDQFNQSEVQSLQSEVQALKTQIQDLEAKDQSHQSEVQALKNQIQDLETKDQSHQSEVQALKTQDQALKNQIQNMEAKDQSHQSEIQVLKIQMQTLENSQVELQNSPRVAFYAGLFTGGRSSPFNKLIKYNKVVTNVGGAYSNDTGKFTAPLKGLYVFTYVVFTNNNYIEVKLMRNTETVAHAHDDSTGNKRDSSSGVAVVTLEAGDTVYMELMGQISYSSSTGFFTTFSGFLLSPM